MSAGIHDNVTLTEVKVDKSPNGNDFLEITFTDENGRTVTETEWQNKKGMWIKTDEDLQTRDNQQFGRILQVINAIIPAEKQVDAELNTFVEMITWVKDQLIPYIPENKKLRIKTVYDNKGYITTSHNGVFVESMSVTTSKIEKLPRDRFERPVIADAERTSDPLSTPTTPDDTKKTDDLPF
jgi:hypothetical protein